MRFSVKGRWKEFVAINGSIAAIIVLTGISGCGQNDVDVGGRDTAPAQVINMPNHFSSVAHKCDGHGHRIYEGDHGDSGKGGGGLAVVADPSCPGGATPRK
jgi:hypothetical protein